MASIRQPETLCGHDLAEDTIKNDESAAEALELARVWAMCAAVGRLRPVRPPARPCRELLRTQTGEADAPPMSVVARVLKTSRHTGSLECAGVTPSLRSRE